MSVGLMQAIAKSTNAVTKAAYVLKDGCFENLNFPDPTKPPAVYHRDDNGNIPDMPRSVAKYFATPLKAKVEFVSP